MRRSGRSRGGGGGGSAGELSESALAGNAGGLMKLIAHADIAPSYGWADIAHTAAGASAWLAVAFRQTLHRIATFDTNTKLLSPVLDRTRQKATRYENSDLFASHHAHASASCRFAACSPDTIACRGGDRPCHGHAWPGYRRHGRG